tara:strand:+ start:1783 stop:2016 length:234 start_codon:yes stop_codon:yes gene_type:complete
MELSGGRGEKSPGLDSCGGGGGCGEGDTGGGGCGGLLGEGTNFVKTLISEHSYAPFIVLKTALHESCILINGGPVNG